MLKDDIYLITFTTATNDIGDTIEVKTERLVFANRKSIRQSEFYQALSVGLKPQIVFEVYAFEYQEEESLSYNGKEYSIIRAFTKGDFTELICEAVK